jgi:hypothetical protein
MDTQTTETAAAPEAATQATFPLLGQPVIVRARDAGVHFGEYFGHAGREVRLTNARRLWFWKTVKGISLSDLAVNGINTTDSRVAANVADQLVLDACEIIAVTPEAATTIREAPVAERR